MASYPVSQKFPGAPENLPTQGTWQHSSHIGSSKVPKIPETKEAIAKSQDDTSDRSDRRWKEQNNKQRQFRQKKFVTAIPSLTGQ